MIQRVFSSLLVILVCQQVGFSAGLELTPRDKRRIESGVIDAFETIISLWKRERFDEIYEYGDKISRETMSKETFISRTRGCVLASSWETVRGIEVEIVSPDHAYLKAKMGFASPSDEWGDTIFVIKIFEMILEKGEWRIDLRELCEFGIGGFRGGGRRRP